MDSSLLEPIATEAIKNISSRKTQRDHEQTNPEHVDLAFMFILCNEQI